MLKVQHYPQNLRLNDLLRVSEQKKLSEQESFIRSLKVVFRE